MATIMAYWRPSSVKQALNFLDRPGAVVLGGGTKLNAEPTPEPVEVVDLQALQLDGIDRLGSKTLLIGAMVTLQRLVDSEDVPVAVRDAAQRERPSTLRAQSTVGGCIVTADPDSELLATLLVHGAVVREVGRDVTEEVDLDAWLADRERLRNRILTAVKIDTGGKTAFARTARTKSDKAIVSAVARSAGGQRRLALTGVAARPILVEEVGELDPPGDFRGTSEYRRSLAAVLGGRVLEAIS